VQLVSKISDLYDPDPPTSQTDRQTDMRSGKATNLKFGHNNNRIYPNESP